MSDAETFRSAQLRHALRTPLNQISGYSEMLIEDLAGKSVDGVRPALNAIRDTGRQILDLLQRELPPDEPAITPDQLAALRERIKTPLATITGAVDELLRDEAGKQAGLNMADVLRIGSAAAEMVDFSAGRRTPQIVCEPDHPRLEIAETPIQGYVLVVDDHPGNRDLLTRMLERHGLTAFSAPDGEAALEQIARQRLDLILLDLMMPGMNGIEVLERIKSDTRWCNIPVIMLSALDETSRVIQSLERGAEDYVLKPFDPVLLIARLRSTLERSRLRAREANRARELQSAYEKLSENEHRLQEGEERLRLATQAADVGILYYYARQNRVFMTAGSKRLFGSFEGDEYVDWIELRKRLHPEDQESADEALQQAAEHETEYDIEFRVVWPDRSVHWLSSRGLAQRYGENGEIRLAGVVIDITRRKDAEEAVLQAQKLESIGLLAGGIAHDFNNLLTGIIGSASFVMDNLPEGDSNTEMIRNIVNAGERAADLTSQLLAYSGKGKFSVRDLDLSALVNEIAVLLRSSISRSVVLERDLQAGLPKIEADATQIQQIVMNLVINGSEAISGEGVVRLSTGVTELGPGNRETFVSGEDIAPGMYVFLEVSDTGVGMDRDTLGKIFEPFFTTKFTGRGMGLAAVFGIVRGHEGALEVRTAFGAGSSFRVFFPPAPGEVAVPSNQAQSRARRIVFLDDEPVVRLLGKTALERAGYEVLTADSPEEAFRILRASRGDIAAIVLDVAMPGWEWSKTFHRLKQMSPALQVVLSSGIADADIRARYPDAEFGALLQKPYSASLLVERVHEALRQGAE